VANFNTCKTYTRADDKREQTIRGALP
jgi:hypothetical protein